MTVRFILITMRQDITTPMTLTSADHTIYRPPFLKSLQVFVRITLLMNPH